MCSFEVAVNKVEDTDHVVIPVHLREKNKQSGYNHTGTPLFGLPFLIAVPRSLSEDKLYNMLLLCLWLVHVCLSWVGLLKLPSKTSPVVLKVDLFSCLQPVCAIFCRGGRGEQRRDATIQTTHCERKRHQWTAGRGLAK